MPTNKAMSRFLFQKTHAKTDLWFILSTISCANSNSQSIVANYFHLSTIYRVILSYFVEQEKEPKNTAWIY